MIRMALSGVLLASISLSGCAGGKSTEKITDCVISYKMNTFPSDKDVNLNVEKVRYDRFGRLSVKPKKGQGISFFGSGWLSPGTFKNINCE